MDGSFRLHDLLLDFIRIKCQGEHLLVAEAVERQSQYLGRLAVLRGYYDKGESLEGFYSLIVLWRKLTKLSGNEQREVDVYHASLGELGEDKSTGTADAFAAVGSLFDLEVGSSLEVVVVLEVHLKPKDVSKGFAKSSQLNLARRTFSWRYVSIQQRVADGAGRGALINAGERCGRAESEYLVAVCSCCGRGVLLINLVGNDLVLCIPSHLLPATTSWLPVLRRNMKSLTLSIFELLRRGGGTSALIPNLRLQTQQPRGLLGGQFVLRSTCIDRTMSRF